MVFVSLCRPVPELVRDIREGNWLRFGPGTLRELCKLLPEDSEVTIPQLYYHCLSMICSRINMLWQNVFFKGEFQCIHQSLCYSSVISTSVPPQVKELMAFSGNLSALDEADQFMVQLVKVAG